LFERNVTLNHMDDYNIQTLTDSRNAYTQIFVSKLYPVINQGFDSIFQDSVKLCIDNDEDEKYLMTFQNFLARIPKWNQTIIDTEVQRIKEETNCNYLEDLLTCVHVAQLKLMTNIRVGTNQKKISIKIPDISTFIHKVYIECARIIYKNVYLYENVELPIQKQKYKRDVESLIKDCIINTIRNNMPIESILRAYLDESNEYEVYDNVEEVEEEVEEVEDKVELETPTTNNNIESSIENIVEKRMNSTDYENMQSISFENEQNERSNQVIVDTEPSKQMSESTSVERNENQETIANDELEKNNIQVKPSISFIGDDISNETYPDTDEDDNNSLFQDDDLTIHESISNDHDIQNLDVHSKSEDMSSLLDIEEL